MFDLQKMAEQSSQSSSSSPLFTSSQFLYLLNQQSSPSEQTLDLDFFWTPLQAIPLNERFSVITPNDEIPDSITDAELVTFAEQIERELEQSMSYEDGISDSQLVNFAEQIEIPPHVERELEHPMSADDDSSEIIHSSRQQLVLAGGLSVIFHS
jgi:hypothetical protein